MKKSKTVKKPRGVSILVFGRADQGGVPALYGQVRGYFTPDGKPVTQDPGKLSIYGEHCEPSDGNNFETAIRGARKEFWRLSNLDRHNFELLLRDFETEHSINDVFVFTRLVGTNIMKVGEGLGMFQIPLKNLPLYVRDGHLTKTSVQILNMVNMGTAWNIAYSG